MSLGGVADPLYEIETSLRPAGLVVAVTGFGDPS